MWQTFFFSWDYYVKWKNHVHPCWNQPDFHSYNLFTIEAWRYPQLNRTFSSALTSTSPVGKLSTGLILPPVHKLRSYLDDCHWLPTCHHSIRCVVRILIHPLPILYFTLATGGCLLVMADCSARILTQATDAWTDTGSPHPHWHEPPPPSWPSGASRASASHTSHPPARQHSTETFGPGFTAPASTSSPPYHQQWVTVYPRLSLWDMLVVQYNGKSCCSTSDKFPQNARLF